MLVQKTLLEGGSAIALDNFTDVPRGDSLWTAVQLSVAHDWLVATGPAFDPRKPMTRAEAANTLARRAGLICAFNVYGTPQRDHARFQDVPLFARSSGDIEALADAGALKGCECGEGRFCPDEPITQADFTRILSALVKKPLGDGGKDPITRGEAAALLYRTAELQAQR